MSSAGEDLKQIPGASIAGNSTTRTTSPITSLTASRDASGAADWSGIPRPVPGALRFFGISLLTLYLVALYGALVYLQVALWQNAGDQTKDQVTIVFPWIVDKTYVVSTNLWLLFFALSIGALGSFIHAATSFADYVGNRRASRSWVVWFIFRPLVGSALALTVYFALRVLTNGTDPKVLNVYGFGFLCLLAGMVSKQATDKLGEVFDSLFKSAEGRGDKARSGKLQEAL